MPTATDVLRHEHRAIRHMLALLGRLAAAPAPDPDLPVLVGVLGEFADRCHHGKEEEHLFPALAARGLPAGTGPVAVMLAEHAQGRELLGQMRAALAEWQAGAPGARARFEGAAQAYRTLLDAHIEKENEVLFVLAERLLDAPAHEALAAAFERHEEAVMGAGRHAELHRTLEDLAARHPAP